MATKKRSHLIADIVKEVEATARRIRADVRRMGKDAKVGRGLARMAADLRKGASHVGVQIDRYAREVQAEVKAAAKKAGKRTAAKKTTKRRAAKKSAAKKRVVKKRSTAKARKR